MISSTLLTVASFLLAASSTRAQLSSAQIESVFGEGATGLTGNSVKLPQYTFTVVTNATHALINLNQSVAASSVGWMASGVGTAMMNADFLIGWPTQQAQLTSSTPSFTLSHRQSPSGEFMPQLVSTASGLTTTSFFTFLPALSSNLSDPFTAYSYLRPLNMPTDYPTSSSYKTIARGPQNFIYASCTVKPGSLDEGATLTQHDQAHATFVLDLSPAITLSSSSSSNSSSPSSSGSGGVIPTTTSSAPKRSKRDMYLIAHASVGAIALLILSPTAILIGRFLRGSTWFPAHAAFNVLAAILVVCAFALGYTHAYAPHFHDTHTKLGLALLILMLVQVTLGAVAHRIPATLNHSARFPTLSGKSPVRLFHMFLGMTIVILGYVQIALGFAEYPKYSDGQQKVPMGAKIVFYIILGLSSLAWFVGWAKEGASSGKKGEYGVEKVNSGSNSP